MNNPESKRFPFRMVFIAITIAIALAMALTLLKDFLNKNDAIQCIENSNQICFHNSRIDERDLLEDRSMLFWSQKDVNEYYEKRQQAFKYYYPYNDKDRRRQRTMQINLDKHSKLYNNPIVEDGNITLPDYCNGHLDVVWTFVNSSDPHWIYLYEKYNRFVPKNRYQDYGSLKYSMRSVYSHIKFAKRWFLVVADKNQIPSYLDKFKFHSKNSDGIELNIVYHRDIFPKSSNLPTFNSNAIESGFHNIKELGECFIYLNDDFFIGSDLTASFFFKSNGQMITYVTQATVPVVDRDGSDWTVEVESTNTYLNDHYHTSIRRNFINHNCYLFRKSVLQEINNNFKQMNETRDHRFRKYSDVVVPFINGHYSIEKGYSVLRHEPYKEMVYFSITNNLSSLRRVFNFVRKHQYKCFCINDEMTKGDITVQALAFKDAMDLLYIEKTPFEY